MVGGCAVRWDPELAILESTRSWPNDLERFTIREFTVVFHLRTLA